MSALLELSRLGKTYPTPMGPSVILRDVNLKVRRGVGCDAVGRQRWRAKRTANVKPAVCRNSSSERTFYIHRRQNPGFERRVVPIEML